MVAANAQYHQKSIDSLFNELSSSPEGLGDSEAGHRLVRNGPNILPTQPPPTLLDIFISQFRNPLIYILVIAAIVSISLGDHSDATFIGIVLFLNAIVGTIQEYSAEKSAQALRLMSASRCLVRRAGEALEIDAKDLVIGDVVILESGQKVPADLRLFNTHSLEIDESLLTGESEAVGKSLVDPLPAETALGDRKNMAFTGSLITKGRGSGLVVATGSRTELGKIASSISSGEDSKPPLLIRMERFTKKIALILMFVTAAMAIFLFYKGQGWHEVLMFSVAIAVSAIPEGLPVALTVALAIASRRMAKRNVIIRKLPAVEALGSCSFIATDKTGTLTVNQLTIKKIALPGLPEFDVEGSGLNPAGQVHYDNGLPLDAQKRLTQAIVQAGVLCNESRLVRNEDKCSGSGDAVDLALLVLAHKFGLDPEKLRSDQQLINQIPYEPELQYAASLHGCSDNLTLSVKGSIEKILPMCKRVAGIDGFRALDAEAIIEQVDQLAGAGYRVIAVAAGDNANEQQDLQAQLNGLCFLGLVAMIDPLRAEAAQAIKSCQQAGVNVAMITGDHPKTAYAIAKELRLTDSLDRVVTGPRLKDMPPSPERDQLLDNARVFARVEPQQKLEVVRHLIDRGCFVAVTGDGANDAPALKAANVGVAMGQSGTDIARETSDLIITDDKFASIVAGVEEGRIAYNNVRKVVYLLISTGFAEIILFTLSLFFNLPLPLTAVQILWLNLVTNGIQDIGLAFEPREGHELSRPPRSADEPIFDWLMLERVIISALVVSLVSFAYFFTLIESGVETSSARNLTLLLMVLFENVMVGNCRSETKSAFAINPLSNKVLLFGTIAAQLIHISTLYVPGINEVLATEPVSFLEWVKLLLMASSVLVVMELHKIVRKISFSTTKVHPSKASKVLVR